MKASPSDARCEHLAWCLVRAHEFLDAGDVVRAGSSLMSDLNKFPETRGHPAIHRCFLLLATDATVLEMRVFLESVV